jgi:hypothetical protein
VRSSANAEVAPSTAAANAAARSSRFILVS